MYEPRQRDLQAKGLTMIDENAKSLWKISTLLGLATAIFGLILMPMFPATGAGYVAGYGEPVFAFEFARSASDLLLVFGKIDDPARGGRIADMVRGTYWDFGFLLIYSGFIAIFFFGAFKQTGSKVWLAFAALGLIAGLGDFIENTILLGLLDDIEAAKNLALLPFPVYTKFIAIAICGLATGCYLFRAHNLIWKGLGLVAIISALAVIPGLVQPQSFGQHVGSAITIFWVIQLVYAGWVGFSKRA